MRTFRFRQELAGSRRDPGRIVEEEAVSSAAWGRGASCRVVAVGVAVWASAAGGCYEGLDLYEGHEPLPAPAEDTDSSVPPAPPSEPDSDAQTIDVRGSMEVDAWCVNAPHERDVQSISPSGEAWLVDSRAEQLIVLGPNAKVQMEFTFATEGLGRLHAWNDVYASFIASGRLWRTDPNTRPQLAAWPPGLPQPTDFCGDPSTDGDGVVIAGNAIYRREQGFWWRWTLPSGENFGPLSSIARGAGACVDSEGAAWLLDESRTLWRVHAEDTRPVEGFDDVAGATFVPAIGVVGWRRDTLLVRNLGESSSLRFPDGDPIVGVSGSESTLWVLTPGRLWRYDGADWLEAVPATGAPAENLTSARLLGADATGVWIGTATEAEQRICRLTPRPNLDLHGLRPLERLSAPVVSLEVFGDALEKLEDLTLVLDAKEVHRHDGSAPWLVEALDLGPDGWHVLELVSGGRTLRRLEIELRQPKLATWQEDIDPLAAQHCALAGCHDVHAEGNRPSLADYQDWVDNADAIRLRVAASDMPPPAARLETWTPEAATTILSWIESGMPEGEGL